VTLTDDSPERPPADPPEQDGPPRWIRITTHGVALAWGTLELAMWGGRPGPLAFIAGVLALSWGAEARAKVRDLLR
jgi:hypothetical protein